MAVGILWVRPRRGVSFLRQQLALGFSPLEVTLEPWSSSGPIRKFFRLMPPTCGGPSGSTPTQISPSVSLQCLLVTV